jgi:hypothetical protein
LPLQLSVPQWGVTQCLASGARSLPKESGSLKTDVENILNTMRAA